MSKPSQQVENQRATGEKVVASAKAHTAKISAALAERSVVAQGQNTPATTAVWEIVLLSAAAQLERAGLVLYKADQKVATERSDDVHLRAERDAAHAALLDAMVHVRGAVELALGQKGLQSYGLQGETPRANARSTLNHAVNVVHQLETNPASIASGYGTTFDTAPIVTALKAKTGTLEVLLGSLDTEARELEDVLSERNRAVAAWIETYRAVADTLTGLYRLAGWVELAERVRPTVRAAQGDEVISDLPEGGHATGGNTTPVP